MNLRRLNLIRRFCSTLALASLTVTVMLGLSAYLSTNISFENETEHKRRVNRKSEGGKRESGNYVSYFLGCGGLFPGSPDGELTLSFDCLKIQSETEIGVSVCYPS